MSIFRFRLKINKTKNQLFWIVSNIFASVSRIIHRIRFDSIRLACWAVFYCRIHDVLSSTCGPFRYFIQLWGGERTIDRPTVQTNGQQNKTHVLLWRRHDNDENHHHMMMGMNLYICIYNIIFCIFSFRNCKTNYMKFHYHIIKTLL